MTDKKDPKKSPWGTGKKTKKATGSTSAPKKKTTSNQDNVPDMEEVLKKAQEQISTILGGGNGGRGQDRKGGRGGNGKTPPPAIPANLPIGKLVILGLILWGLTGFYRVLPEENVVVKTFGEWTATKETPGLGYHIPFPVQSVEKVNVTFERRIEIGFRDQAPRRNRAANDIRSNGSDIPSESLMLTGDENIIDIDFVVLWRINDAGKYLFEIRDPETTIKKVAESAMREIIGRTKIQQALTEGRAQIEQDTKILMQQMLDDYSSGIEINDVQLQKVDPPAPVVDAFDDVQRARADKERLRNEAEAYRNDILPKARGESEKIIQEAEAYREEVINRATGDANRFTAVYKAYAKDKDVTAERIYIETLEEILQNTQKIIIDSDKSGVGNVLPYLPLNELKKK